MMQHAKLMSLPGLAVAKQEIDDALNDLEADPSNTQAVYTNLTHIYNMLADLPQAQLTVDSRLAYQTSVQLLRDLVRLHLREEEVQWVLGRVIAVACDASIRFQCLAGQLDLWNELFDMRSTHPQSVRVQEVSLRASEKLFRRSEFNAAKLRPLLLLNDLLGVMDRFRRVQTPRRRAHQLVVLALRVLLALYSSPRSVKLLLFNGEGSSEGGKWASEISTRMLESFAIFNNDIEAIRSWLDMILLLLRQHPIQALASFFSSDSYKKTPWWFMAVIEKWQPQNQVINALFTTLTHIFALPHNTLGDHEQIALAERLIVEQNLLDVLCAVIGHYHTNVTLPDIDKATAVSQNDSVELVLFEAIRLVRQWTERPVLLSRLGTSRSVTNTVLPVLIHQLQLHTRPPLSSKQLVFVLETLLVLRHLATIPNLRNALVISDKLQLSLKELHRGKGIPRPLTALRSAGTATSNSQDDGDLVALVTRQAQELQKLLGLDVGLKSAAFVRKANQRSNATVIVVKAAPRKLRVDHVRIKTLWPYR